MQDPSGGSFLKRPIIVSYNRYVLHEKCILHPLLPTLTGTGTGGLNTLNGTSFGGMVAVNEGGGGSIKCLAGVI